MKSHLALQIQQISQLIDKLEDVLGNWRDTSALHQEAREKLLRQVWSQGKELSVLNESATLYEQTRAENARLQALHTQLSERLTQTLGDVKKLRQVIKEPEHA